MIPDRNERVETSAIGDHRGGSWRRPLVGAGIGLALFVGGVGGYLLARAAAPRPSAVATQAATRATADPGSAQRQTAMRRLTALAVADFSPFDPAREEPRGFVPPIVLSPPYETVNSAVFDTADRRIRLARIRPLGRNEVCFDQAQFRFACGLMGRAALQNALSGREVVCRPRFEIALRDARRFSADCRTEAGDLAEILVRRGFALPSELDDRGLAAAVAEARAARRGVWAGPYVEAEADPTAEDERDVPFLGARAREATPDLAAMVAVGAAAAEATPAGEPARAEAPRAEAPRAAVRPPAREKPRRAADPPSRRPPPLEEHAPHATQPGGVSVVAGPIRPPPPALARRLGVAVPAETSETISTESSSNR